jgi:hypothetical protein
MGSTCEIIISSNAFSWATFSFANNVCIGNSTKGNITRNFLPFFVGIWARLEDRILARFELMQE